MSGDISIIYTMLNNKEALPPRGLFFPTCLGLACSLAISTWAVTAASALPYKKKQKGTKTDKSLCREF